jgi:hypothetical protein
MGEIIFALLSVAALLVIHHLKNTGQIGRRYDKDRFYDATKKHHKEVFDLHPKVPAIDEQKDSEI